MQLRELAHSRTGDKGDTLNVSVICRDLRDYLHLREHVTAERVHAHLRDVVHGDVTRFEMPEICALNFVLRHALGGGVTRSLALDAHGKSLGSALLSLDVPVPLRAD
ncbi:AtuA-related protein [Paraburkholderia sp.]|uniref:AtuA-related protein n=1 Tax=Paraburkholderia sp. TaxID=1926495 RepID=UPI003D6F957B